jgi:DnaJ-class molecular chaperone
VCFARSPGYTKTVPDEGMPYANDPTKLGDLVIEFNIVFPRTLSQDKKAMLRKALPNCV